MPFRKRPRDPAKQKVERFEGRWQVVAASPYPEVRGKIEWDGFASGDSEIELFAVVPDLHDGSELIVMWGDVEVMTGESQRRSRQHGSGDQGRRPSAPPRQ